MNRWIVAALVEHLALTPAGWIGSVDSGCNNVALDGLERMGQRLFQVVQLRYFAGLTV